MMIFGVIFKVALLASNIKREVCDVLESFYFYFKDMKKQKLTTCNMMFLMLELRFKNLHLIILIGYEEGVNEC
jgi:hypothetical protein